MTPRVDSGRKVGKTDIIQEDVCRETLFSDKVPKKSARHFLLCVAQSHSEHDALEAESDEDKPALIH